MVNCSNSNSEFLIGKRNLGNKIGKKCSKNSDEQIYMIHIDKNYRLNDNLFYLMVYFYLIT